MVGNGNQVKKEEHLERTLKRLLTSIVVELSEASVNFFVYQDEDKVLEHVNIKRFYNDFLNEPEFRDKYMNFRVHAGSCIVGVKNMTEEEAEISARAENILLMNSAYKHKVGILTNV